MAQRHHHYEQAFERYLRARRIPYVAVDEAKKALLPQDHAFRARLTQAGGCVPADFALKSFDFVIYGQGGNLLLEVKGRRVARAARQSSDARADRGVELFTRPPRARLESWVGLDDVESLKTWQQLFGPEFRAVFVFVYWCEEQPPDGLFQEIFDHNGRWYAVRTVMLDEYTKVMRTRSPRWRTVHLPTEAFERISCPLTPALEQVGVGGASGRVGEPAFEPL